MNEHLVIKYWASYIRSLVVFLFRTKLYIIIGLKGIPIKTVKMIYKKFESTLNYSLQKRNLYQTCLLHCCLVQTVALSETFLLGNAVSSHRNKAGIYSTRPFANLSEALAICNYVSYFNPQPVMKCEMYNFHA